MNRMDVKSLVIYLRVPLKQKQLEYQGMIQVET